MMKLRSSSKRTDTVFSKLYQAARNLERAIMGEDFVTWAPRRVNRSTCHANAPAQTVEQYYRINFYYPYVDSTLEHLKTRFPPQLRDTLLGYYLVPSKLVNLKKEDIVKMKLQYGSDLPSPETLHAEVERWTQRFPDTHSKGDIPKTLQESTSFPMLIHCCTNS